MAKCRHWGYKVIGQQPNGWMRIAFFGENHERLDYPILFIPPNSVIWWDGIRNKYVHQLNG